jgi:RNA-directed DNA polymerase
MEKRTIQKPLSWHEIDWKLCFENVERIQEEIVKAVRFGKRKQVLELQRQLVVMFETRALAIRHIVSNQGSKTAGIDNIHWKNPKDYFNAIQELGNITKNPNQYKASSVKRIYIPKPGTNEQRPLGIPTLIDRALQKVYHFAIDPVVECQSDKNSYGFRKHRSTQDAITTLRSLLDKPTSPTMILETDIAKCFEKIDHKFLINNTPICDKHILSEWLSSGISVQGHIQDTEEGTPQGGVISPLLCNVALNGLEELTKTKFKAEKHSKTLGSRPKIHIIRYADDIVITGVNSELLEEVKKLLIEFLAERGLKLKEAKTRIVNIQEGFDFLGYNLKRKDQDHTKNKNNEKQTSVLVIQPTKKNIQKLKTKIKEIIDRRKPIEALIRDLNPILRGWSEYFRISYHSQMNFINIGNYVWTLMWRWARKRHPRRNAKYLFAKYTRPTKSSKWTWMGTLNKPLFNISEVTTYILRPLKQDINPYIIENKEYYEMRKAARALTKFRTAIYKKYEHKCIVCEQSLHNEEKIELHHINPVKKGGKYTMENIVPMHKICHQKITHNTVSKPQANFDN